MDHIKIIKAISARPKDTQGRLIAGELDVVCAFGRSGLTDKKEEGDGATPIGKWPLRQLFHRPDRPAPPKTNLPVIEIAPDSGWCDDPRHDSYNQLVKLPFAASHEQLWRDDELYDLMVPLGYNDDVIVAGKGSAIFFHLARNNYQPTEGCVAIAEEHMRALLPLLSPETTMQIEIGT